MGASGWSYFVPYQPDIITALQKLRQQVFERGEYFKLDHGDWRSIDEEEMRRRLQDEDPEIADIILNDWRHIKSLPEPDTIDRLLDWNVTEGTHSILDINRGVSDQPDFGTVSPLTDEQLIHAFNTTQPHHQQVEGWIKGNDFYELRERWEALYVVVYDGESPVEICFAGFSGD